jgi:hypothetical protein
MTRVTAEVPLRCMPSTKIARRRISARVGVRPGRFADCVFGPRAPRRDFRDLTVFFIRKSYGFLDPRPPARHRQFIAYLAHREGASFPQPRPPAVPSAGIRFRHVHLRTSGRTNGNSSSKFSAAKEADFKGWLSANERLHPAARSPWLFEPEDAEEAGEIRAELERLGTPIGPYDVLIASQARRRDAVLITANTLEFARCLAPE